MYEGAEPAQGLMPCSCRPCLLAGCFLKMCCILTASLLKQEQQLLHDSTAGKDNYDINAVFLARRRGTEVTAQHE